MKTLLSIPHANSARVTSAAKAASIKAVRARNQKAKARQARVEELRLKHEHADFIKGEYEEGITKALKRGQQGIRVPVYSSRVDLSVPEMMKENEDTPLLRRIWASLRRRGYNVVIKKKSEYHSGFSFYEGISDEDPWYSYEFTAMVTW